MSFDFLFLDVFESDKFSFIGKASKNNLITAQMNDWVWEDVDDLSEYFFDQFVSLFESNVKGPHVPTTKSTGDILVLRGFSPTGCVAGCIKLWNNSDSSYHGVSDQLPRISAGISLFRTEGCILSDFRM